MSEYKVHGRHLIDGSMAESGSVINCDGNPGSGMEPMDAAAVAKINAYDAGERQRQGLTPLKRPYSASNGVGAAGPPKPNTPPGVGEAGDGVKAEPDRRRARGRSSSYPRRLGG